MNHRLRHSYRLILFLLAAAWLLSACAARSELSAPFGAEPERASSSTPAQPSAGTSDLIKALQEAGAAASFSIRENAQPMFGQQVETLLVNNALVQVFSFPDEASMQQAAGAISSDGTMIGDIPVRWIDQPNFWASDRWIVLYLGADPELIRLLTGVLGDPIAGPALGSSPDTTPETVDLAPSEEAVTDYAGFRKSLGALDVLVAESGEASGPFFQIAGKQLKVNGVDVTLYEYADEAARTAVSDTVLPNGSIGGAMIHWKAQPYFWASGRLIVVYVGEDFATVSLLNRVMGNTAAIQ